MFLIRLQGNAGVRSGRSSQYIYDNGVDRTGRQGIEEKYSKQEECKEKKNNPQTMLLGEYSVRTGKTPQQQKHIIHHRHTTLQQGK